MYLGIDLGTSGVKVLLIDEEQTVIASTTSHLNVSKPQSGWSEQMPDDWITATKSAILELRQQYPSAIAAVKAIGLSGQMHGATLLDKDDKVLRSCILWNDTRSYLEAQKLDSNPLFRERTGNIVFPGFTAPKLLWVKQHEENIFTKIKKILLPKDYLRLWLIGDYCSDMSDSSGTSWLDVANRRWDSDLLDACHLTIEHMPNLVEGSEPSGTIRKTLASELGLSKGVIVAGGAGDNAASAIATGTIQSGSAFISIGTSGTLFAANDSYQPNPESAVHAFCHAIPNSFHQMGVILSATAALNWYSGIVGETAQILTGELGDTLRAPSHALFLPYLAGERTPHNNAQIRASFHGLGGEMDRKYLTQAVLEGVAFALRDNLEALRETGTELTQVTAVGGGMNSLYWLKTIATALQIPIHVPNEGDLSAAFGAARLGILATGISTPSDLCQTTHNKTIIDPDKSHIGAFEEAYSRYKRAYTSNERIETP